MKAAILLALAAAAPASAVTVQTSRYGVTDGGRAVDQVTLRNRHGMIVRFLSYGGIITDIDVPDRRGKAANVVLGYGSFADYQTKVRKNFFGALAGRYAGRIAGAAFTLDGHEVRLQPNDGPNALHGGGTEGFESRLWRLKTFVRRGAAGAVLSYTSPAGEQGFPGNLSVSVTYTLDERNALRIDYMATTDAPTVLNLTNHSYFNLAGAGSGTVANQQLRIFAGRYIVTDDAGIPTGAFAPVARTPLDFTRPLSIGAHIDDKTPPMSRMGGYNHAWLLDKPAGVLAPAAEMSDPPSGRTLTVLTTEPSLQAYTGDYIDGKDVGAQGVVYRPRDGIALETQHLSDSPNHPAFPTTVLRPGQIYRSTTIFRFAAKAAED